MIATTLFAFMPGHFFMSVQVADTQFWLLAFIGSIYHKMISDTTGRKGHYIAHLLFLVFSCLSSWFGYLCVAVFLCHRIGQNLIIVIHRQRLLKMKSILDSSCLLLLGIGLATFLSQLALLYALAGPECLDILQERFNYWVQTPPRLHPTLMPFSGFYRKSL